MTKPVQEAESFVEASALTYDRHASALGRVSLVWTELHEVMGKMFARLVSRDDQTLGLAAWNALSNDRAQRSMLLAVAKATLEKADSRLVELAWAIGQMDSLENNRNDALHSPYTMTIFNGSIRIIPNYFQGQRRAMNLKDRDLETELTSYQDNIWSIVRYVSAISRALFPTFPRNRLVSTQPTTLPPRPLLPKPAHGSTQKRSSSLARQRKISPT